MQAVFGAAREHNNNIYYKEYTDDKGSFHFHSQIELYFVDGGQMEVVINNQKRLLGEGEMSVAISFEPHSYKTVEHSASSVLIIPTYVCEEFVSKMKDKKVTNPFICDREKVRKIKECAAFVADESLNEIIRIGYIYVILGTVMESVCYEQVSESAEPELSARLLMYIHDNYKTDITLSTLAGVFGYSESHLSRYFKNCFNIGINDYLTIIRLKNAIALMHKRKYSMTYCALESGFNSMRTFYRAFRGELKCSPGEYLASAEEV